MTLGKFLKALRAQVEKDKTNPFAEGPRVAFGGAIRFGSRCPLEYLAEGESGSYIAAAARLGVDRATSGLKRSSDMSTIITAADYSGSRLRRDAASVRAQDFGLHYREAIRFRQRLLKAVGLAEVPSAAR